MERMGDIALTRKTLLKKNATPAEVAFKELLNKYKISYAFQKICYTNNRYYILDFVVGGKKRILFEIDGKIHGSQPIKDKLRENDILSTRTYKRFHFVRIKNEQVFSGEAEEVLSKLFVSKFNKYKKLKFQ